MKHFYKYLSITFLLFLNLFDSAAQINRNRDIEIVQQHPRILLFKGEEAHLINTIKKDPVWTMLHNVS